MIRFLLFFSTLGALACTSDNDQKLTIATAANMQFAMSELTKVFTEQTGIECQTVISSSGKLTAQIQQGAPYDIFVSADMKYPEVLFESGKAIQKPAIYAYGSLVMWTTIENLNPSVEVLSDPKIQHIAIANPKTAPYGQAAVEILEYYKIKSELEPKLVFGESIAQTNQFITTQAAEIGFTAKAVVKAPFLQNKGQWTALPPEIHQAIAQGILLLKTDDSRTAPAQKFNDFLFSAQGQDILNKFGYSVPD